MLDRTLWFAWQDARRHHRRPRVHRAACIAGAPITVMEKIIGRELFPVRIQETAVFLPQPIVRSA